jgi:lambda family phage minor tail protein L
MPTTPNVDLQNINQTSPFVELFTVDCTDIGGSVYRFTPMTDGNDSSVSFGGITYQPLPIITTGWELNSTGTQPRPTLSVSNVSKVLLSAVVSLGDIVGAKVTRIRTFAKYLDNGSSPDGNMYLPADVFVVEQKISHDNTMISWQLSSTIERLGMKLPRRQILKDEAGKNLYAPGVSRTRIA